MTTHDKIIFLLEFFYDNSRLPCINDTEIDGINLYEFMQDIEMCEIILEDNDRKAVEDIGIKINKKKEQNHNKVMLLVEYYLTFNKWPKHSTIFKNVKIGVFMSNIKRYDRNPISKADKKILEKFDFEFQNISEIDKTHQKVLILIDFFNTFNRWPKANEMYKGINISNFYYRLKNLRCNSLLYDDRNLLVNLGFKFNSTPRSIKIHQKVLILIEFYNKFQRWPKYNEEYRNEQIGAFSMRIKQKRVKLSKNDIEELKKLNFQFETVPAKEIVHRKVLLLIEFFTVHKRLPKYREVYKNVKIGFFLRNIKQKNTSLSISDKQLLETHGIYI